MSARHLRDHPRSLPLLRLVLQCVALKPTWGKGYSRLGAAYFGLEDYAEAVSAYEQGLQHDPASEQLQGALADAKAAAARPPPGSSPFSKPEFLAKMAMDPRGRALMGQPDFQLMLRDVQNNPSSMGKYLQDPRFQIVSATKALTDVIISSRGGARPPFTRLEDISHLLSSFLYNPSPAPPSPPASHNAQDDGACLWPQVRRV